MLVDRPTFLRSEFYNVLWRAAGIHEPLMLGVRSAGRIRAMLHIYRAAGETAFESNDIKMLELIAGFVAHSITRVTLREEAFADSDDRAMFVTDNGGMVRHAAGSARHLLMMALNPRFSSMANRRGLEESVPELARLCRTLASVANGEIGQPPPVLRLRNYWGEFVLRAYWLGPTDGAEQTRQIAITIERRVPRALVPRHSGFDGLVVSG